MSFAEGKLPIANLSTRFERVSCPSCAYDGFIIHYTGRDWYLDPSVELHVVRCVRCGFHYTNPRPTPDHLPAYYPDTYTCHTGPTDAEPSDDRPILNLIHRHLHGAPQIRPSGFSRILAATLVLLRGKAHFGAGIPFQGKGRLLDFGCGQGRFLRRMASLGWDVTGLDFAPKAVECVRAAGLNAFHGTLPHPDLPRVSFDVVTMNHSLEHVPDPAAVLRGAHDVLATDGQLLIAVPNYDAWDIRYFGDASLGLQLPLHLSHFTPQTIANLVRNCGFDVQWIRQEFRTGWIKRVLPRAAQRRGPRRTDRWLHYSTVRSLVGRYAQLRHQGNQLRLLARKINEFTFLFSGLCVFTF